MTTVVVVTWRGVAHLTECLDAVAAQDRPHRIVVVDNASDDGTAALLATHPSRPEVLRLPRNTGYAGGIAAALAMNTVDTPYVAWLNDDAAPRPDWLGKLEDAMRPSTGALTSVLELPGGTVQSTGVGLTADGHGADLTDGRPPFGFCGGAALLRTSALREAGGVPAHFFCYYEDTDTAWRLRLAGWDIEAVPGAVVRHRHGASTVPGSTRFHHWNERNRLLMLLRCAPATVAARELARFAAITALLPVRGLLGSPVPRSANFRIALRVRVLRDVAGSLLPSLRQRRAIGRLGCRGAVWRRWACR
ncbi:glycosyltransferase family 2 protein [Saccharomonospora sp. NPDC006951]